MNIEQFYGEILVPSLDAVADICGINVSDEALCELLTIGQQESGLKHRYQISSDVHAAGPARGWFQFERAGGVQGVMKHPSSSERAKALCAACAVDWNASAIWRALEGHDLLAVGFARLLLWTDPKPLPKTEQDGWDYYVRNWRPGKPHPLAWPAYWAASKRLVP